jgi:hypothetical protein
MLEIDCPAHQHEQGNDNHYNEFQSDSSANDNTANATNSNLQTIINNKLAALNLSGYNAQMIMNRAERQTG